MHSLNIKPLSVNCAWQGKRYKTPAYRQYARELTYLLPKMDLPPPPYVLILEFGLSSTSDYDNPVKPFQDVLSAKYGFNDRLIMGAYTRKNIVSRGEEYIFWDLRTFSEELDRRLMAVFQDFKPE